MSQKARDINAPDIGSQTEPDRLLRELEPGGSLGTWRAYCAQPRRDPILRSEHYKH